MPIYMVFRCTDNLIYYVASYESYAEADVAVKNMNLSKPANTSFLVMNGTRYE